MKQSISFRLVSLAASVFVTAVWFESVAQLGHAAPEGSPAVAVTTAVAPQL